MGTKRHTITPMLGVPGKDKWTFKKKPHSCDQLTTTRVPQLFGWHALQSPLDTVINCSLYHMSEAVLTSIPRLR